MRDKKDLNKDLNFLGEGHDPTEEVGPDAAIASPVDAEVEASTGIFNAKPEDSFFSIIDELAEPFTGVDTPIIKSPIDGLPIHADSSQIQIAAAFTYDNVTCVEDDRIYVERFHEEMDLKTAVNFSCRYRFDSEGNEHERENFRRDEVVLKWGQKCVLADGKYIPVKPVREACKYYKRQVFSNDDIPDPDAPGHRLVFRNCTERRSVGGAFLSLRDEAVFACDYRDPVDPKSIDRFLDSRDREKLNSDAHKIHLPLFNIT